MARNIINIEGVSKAFDIRPLLVDVSLGISEGERIGILVEMVVANQHFLKSWQALKSLMPDESQEPTGQSLAH